MNKFRNMAPADLTYLTLEGCSKEKYSFTGYPFNKTFNKTGGGVYCISKRTAFNNEKSWDHIYIGITEDFSTRFDNHHKADCFLNHEANFIFIKVEENESKRKKIERDLLCNNNFPCNEQLN